MRLILLVLFVSLQTMNAQTFGVTFRITTHSLPEDENIYITGSAPELGNWNPSSVKLNKLNDSTWEKTFEFKTGTVIEYKFTRGSWDTEALDKNGIVPHNYSLTVLKDTLIKINVIKWRDQGVVNPKFKGKITGTVKYHKQMKGKAILPRDVVVWLPPNYEKNIEKRYPVLYMHDGQNIFNPATSSFGVDWQVDEAADSLIRIDEIEPLIIVGVYNTSDRSDDYTPNPKGYAYMDFLVHTLKPFIDSNYRTLPDRENTAVAGSSLGGLISFMLGWERSDIFSKAGCLSPAFVFNNINYVIKVEKDKKPENDVLFYIDNGGVGLDEKLQPGIDMMLNILERKGFEEEKNFVWIKAKDARHFEADWAKRIPFMLKLFFGE